MTLVCVSGWGMSAAVWQPLLQALGWEKRAMMLDLSSLEPRETTEQALQLYWQKQLAGLPQSAVYVGWSLGGLAVLALARCMPERVSKCVLLASSPYFPGQDAWPGLDAAGLARYQQLWPRSPARVLRNFLALHTGEIVLRRRASYLQLSVSKYHVAMGMGLRLLAEHDERAHLNSLSVPCHIRLGVKDNLLPSCLSSSLSNLSARIYVALAAEEGHMALLSAPPALCSYLRGVVDVW